VPQCKIFLGQIAVPTNYGFFSDPDPSVGSPGDVVINDSNGNYGLSDEMIELGEMAHDHWSAHPTGILAIAINRFVLGDRSQIGVRGYGLPPTNTQRPFVYIVDPAFIPSGVDNEHIFAHEVGHALGLCHTDECDQLNGASSIQNLMNPDGSVTSTRLVESQCITARTTYPSLFETAPEVPSPSGFTVSYRRASAPVPDVENPLLHVVQISSEVSATSGVRLDLRTRRPMNGKRAFFWVSLDLDADVGTGLDSGMVAPRGTHAGTDLIVGIDAGNVTNTRNLGARGSSFVPGKILTLPDGGSLDHCPWDTTPTPLQLALASGHRWLAMLASGEVRSMKEIARRESVNDSYVSRMVNLTTLAPDIVAAILNETLPSEVTLFELAAGTPLLWEEQWRRLEGIDEQA
jgi:hypothetical protein